MKFCLIGEKLSHSYSKEIHNFCGLDYTLKEIVRCGVQDFVQNSSYHGFNVTIPYKKDVLPFLNEVSSEAKAIGAVNTVLNKNGKLYGFNTDVDGIEYTFKRKGINLSLKKVLILGTGGASKAVEFVCKKYGAECILVSRSGEINYQNCYDIKGVNVIVNATPVGMYPLTNETPIDLSKFNNLEFVFDLIYNPQKTLLIKQAEKLNISYSNGLPMLVEQALKAQDIWLSKTHSDRDTEEIISKLSGDKLNIALMGMPGCGKSTVGRVLADYMGKEFIDLDEEITLYKGKTPSEIIAELGEKEFRDIETKVLNKVAIKSGVVIALGGGAVIKEENRRLLSLNSVTVYLKRDLALLEKKNRPLSNSVGVDELYKQRKEFYETADIVVDNDKSVDKCVKEIANSYEIARNKWS